MEPTTVIVGIASLVLGWGLKTLTDNFTWRRQQVLDAYLAFLNAGDRCGNEVARIWSEGQVMQNRNEAWVDHAQRARELLQEVDTASGRVFLVAASDGGRTAIEVYVALERMYRRAIAVPPRNWDNYQAAALEMVKGYHRVVDQARREMALRTWRDRIVSGESRFELTDRLLKELSKDDPLPDARPPNSQAAPEPRIPKG